MKIHFLCKVNIQPEVEKGVEDGKELPRKFLRLAESFRANHTRYVAFCENLSNHVKIYGYERLISIYPSWNLRKRNNICEKGGESGRKICTLSVRESAFFLAGRNLILKQLLSVALSNIPLGIFFL